MPNSTWKHLPCWTLSSTRWLMKNTHANVDLCKHQLLSILQQVHRPTAICHQDSLWGVMDFFKTTFIGFSISSLGWYDLRSHELNAAQTQCQDSWPLKIFRLLSKVRNMLETAGMFNISASGEASSEQSRHSVENRVNKKHYCVSVLFGPASHRIQH